MAPLQVHRLKTREQYQAVLAYPPYVRTEHFVMHRMVPQAPGAPEPSLPFPAAQHLWVGAMVPKRWARRAVTRNLIKRQVYSIAARHAATLPAAAYLVRLRSAFDRTQFKSASSDALRQVVHQEVEQLFGKLLQPAGALA